MTGKKLKLKSQKMLAAQRRNNSFNFLKQSESGISAFFNTAGKLLGISVVFGTLVGTIIGGFIIYIYLTNIGQLSIYSEIITNSSNLLAAVTFFGFFFSLIIFILFLAHKLGKKLREKELVLFFLIIIIILSLLSVVYLIISLYRLPIFLVAIITILIVFNFYMVKKI